MVEMVTHNADTAQCQYKMQTNKSFPPSSGWQSTGWGNIRSNLGSGQCVTNTRVLRSTDSSERSIIKMLNCDTRSVRFHCNKGWRNFNHVKSLLSFVVYCCCIVLEKWRHSCIQTFQTFLAVRCLSWEWTFIRIIQWKLERSDHHSYAKKGY